MRTIAQKSLALSLVAATLGLMPLATLAAEFTQEGSQQIAEKLNNTASDDSLEASSTSAMMAIMNLSALNIPGAFSNGYRAYGQYINSEKLDNMEAHAIANKGSMGSIANAVMNQTGNSGSRATSFSRLDPSYLYRGDAAPVAAEFEKRSGMRREEFLRQLGDATDSDLTYGDPDLMQKLEGRFHQFTDAIPNKDFKKGLETAANMLPAAARNEALGKLASFYADSWKGVTPAPVVAGGPEPVVAEPQPTAVESSAEAEPAPERAPASAIAEEKLAESSGMLLGLNQNSDALKDLLSSAEGPDKDSIFQKVSNRYRLLTPSLVGKR